MRRSFDGLVDRAIPPAEREAIVKVLEQVRALGGDYHRLRTRAASKVSFVDVHVLVPGTISVHAGHDLVEKLGGDSRAGAPRRGAHAPGARGGSAQLGGDGHDRHRDFHRRAFARRPPLSKGRLPGSWPSSLPLTLSLARWGNEYYGALPVKLPAGEPRRDVFEVGELALWPDGNAFCIFFGPTPASHGTEPRMASPGIGLGRITTDAAVLKSSGPALRANLARLD